MVAVGTAQQAGNLAIRGAIALAVLPVTPVRPERSATGEPPGYYAVAQGKQGAALLRSLHEIVRNGHIDTGYRQARDALFGLVSDPQRTNTVVELYTGRVHTGVTDRKTAFAQKLNTEHTWPQSLGATGIAQSDLHQLMSSDIEINGRRGSLPYGLVQTQQWSTGTGPDSSRLGTDASGKLVFEPRASVRGDIARGLMYFYTRYDSSRTARFSLINFQYELSTLLRWHNQDPVDAVERLRNDDVFGVQHNRNPYVDHPEWAVGDTFGEIRGDRHPRLHPDPRRQ